MVVVIDIHGFQVIRRLQMWRTRHAFGNEFRARGGGENGGAAADGWPRLEGDYLPVDIATIARGMGAGAWNAATPEEVRGALPEACRDPFLRDRVRGGEAPLRAGRRYLVGRGAGRGAP